MSDIPFFNVHCHALEDHNVTIFQGENGLFDKATADAYREHILSKGGTIDAEQMYINFRGRKPNYENLLIKRVFK